MATDLLQERKKKYEGGKSFWCAFFEGIVKKKYHSAWPQSYLAK